MGFSRQEHSHCALCAKLLQSCQTLCDPMDGGPPGSLGFPRQEHWSGLPCLPPGDHPYPNFKPACLMSPALAGRLPLAPPGKPTPVITALHFGLLCSVLIQIPFPHSQAVPCPSMLNYFRWIHIVFLIPSTAERVPLTPRPQEMKGQKTPSSNQTTGQLLIKTINTSLEVSIKLHFSPHIFCSTTFSKASL